MGTIFTKNLKCRLSREEVEQRASRMADVESEIRAVEEQRKSIVADLNGRKRSLDHEIATLGRQVREHAEYRDVECALRPDYGAGITETVRLDTEERVDVRKLFDSEKQPELPLEPASDDGDPGLTQVEAQEAARDDGDSVDGTGDDPDAEPPPDDDEGEGEAP